ncbi:MAG TPA: YiiX/YebB-like N1pC/P60 family cysteine hydrolase [Pseudobdellovibrionaceae bacterium]|nr:YiiX/YebB-like N1pC/P60 family cysteine hydrolase [Pseudobdellovibrionaceae bacterium]
MKTAGATHLQDVRLLRIWGAALCGLLIFGLNAVNANANEVDKPKPSAGSRKKLKAEDPAIFSKLQNGDLVFHTSHSKQSYAIMWASKSLRSHVGVIERHGKLVYVVEAIGRVSRTPLQRWIARGRLKRWEAYHDPRLNDEQRTKMVAAAKTLIGRPYDLHFTSGNKEIYCSELVALAYEKIGLPVGQWQKVRELDVDNPLVRKLALQRWKKHPVCKSEKSFEACWPKILEDTLISPEALAQDKSLVRVFSNYP